MISFRGVGVDQTVSYFTVGVCEYYRRHGKRQQNLRSERALKNIREPWIVATNAGGKLFGIAHLGSAVYCSGLRG